MLTLPLFLDASHPQSLFLCIGCIRRTWQVGASARMGWNGR